MTANARPEGWSQVHDLALIYLSLMHGADAEIDPNEQEVVAEKLTKWCPDVGHERVQKVMDEVMLMYVSMTSQNMLDLAVADVRASMSNNQLVGVLNDLADIANADGVLYDGEVGFIQHLARYWELEQELMRRSGD